MSEPRRTFYVVGISDERDVQLPAAVRERIARGHVFSGGRRHREIVGGWLPEGAVWIDITVPLERVFEQYRDHRDIIVFASGDPLFFRLRRHAPPRLPRRRDRDVPLVQLAATACPSARHAV